VGYVVKAVLYTSVHSHRGRTRGGTGIYEVVRLLGEGPVILPTFIHAKASVAIKVLIVSQN